MVKESQQLLVLKCNMLQLLDKDFKSTIIIMAQELWINSLEKEQEGRVERDRGYNVDSNVLELKSRITKIKNLCMDSIQKQSQSKSGLEDQSMEVTQFQQSRIKD